jgi:uncharacterized protein
VYVGITGADATEITIGLFLASSLGLWVGFALASGLASQRYGTGNMANDLRLAAFRWTDAPVGLGAGIAGQLALLPLLYWPISRWVDLDDLDDAARDLSDAAATSGQFVILAVGVALVAPVLEELFFRGVLLPALADRFGQAPGIVISSAVFALSHLEPIALPGLFAFGVIAALLVRRTGRLAPSILCHIAFNTVVVISLGLDR